MICPLNYRYVGYYWQKPECLKEKCAWWVIIKKQCQQSGSWYNEGCCAIKRIGEKE